MNQQRADELISRIVGRDAGATPWAEFAALAAGDPTLWQALAMAQRDQSAIEQIVTRAGEVAETVEVEPTSSRATGRGWAVAFTGWGGWAVAAGLAAAIFVGGGRSAAPELPDARPVAATPSVDDAFRAYLDAGRRSGQVVGEMPTKVLLETRPRQEGDGYDVLYLRSVVERRTVPDLYRFDAETEQGQPALVRWDQLPGQTM